MGTPLAAPIPDLSTSILSPSIGKPHANLAAEKAKETAQDFEAMFLSIMLDFMWKGPNTDSLFGGGKGEEMFHSVLTQEYGKTMARSGGIGIADTIYHEIIKLQEAAQ